jgi:hypothetical protein
LDIRERVRVQSIVEETTKVSTEVPTSGKEVIPKRDGKTSSWKRVEEYRLNKPVS